MNAKNTPDRIAQIVAEISAITEFAEGSISCSSNRYPVKGGGRRKSAPHWKFQSLGARGKRKYANVPAALVPRVKKLVEAGRRYRRLEAEYARLVTEESLCGLKKKEACGG